MLIKNVFKDIIFIKRYFVVKLVAIIINKKITINNILKLNGCVKTIFKLLLFHIHHFNII